jgi:hypothetical protein
MLWRSQGKIRSDISIVLESIFPVLFYTYSTVPAGLGLLMSISFASLDSMSTTTVTSPRLKVTVARLHFLSSTSGSDVTIATPPPLTHVIILSPFTITPPLFRNSVYSLILVSRTGSLRIPVFFMALGRRGPMSSGYLFEEKIKHK